MAHFSKGRVAGVIRRYYILQLRDLNRIFDIAVWPFFDFMVGGCIALWLTRDTALSYAAYIPLFGIFFWQLLARPNGDIAAFVLEDVWSKNLSNVLCTPLLRREWFSAFMILSVVRTSVVALVGIVTMWCLQSISIGIFGWWLVPMVANLVLTGWIFGLFSASIVLRWGSQATSLVFSIWSLAPLCGVFNPLDIAPWWMQIMGKIFPMTYVFMAIQQFLKTGVMESSLLLTSLLF
ncbi:MAG TPA: ABC transporter permease, partial [Candidatus Limnocylindria bacterium]|nr:ABC transporter permease [Candidatus Limnocylindria bacterium]